MSTKKSRVISLLVCVLFIFVLVASLFYIVKEENHDCTGEDCPICACIQQARQTLKNLGTGMVGAKLVSSVPTLCTLIVESQFLLVLSLTLVSQKVRMND